MNHVAKALVGQALSAVPGGAKAHAWMQRHITHTIPMPELDFGYRCQIALQQLQAIRTHASAPVEDLHLVEIGAGWELTMPQIYRCAGVRKQTLFDLHRLVRLDLMHDAAVRLRRRECLTMADGSVVALDALEPPAGDLDQHLRTLGIEYRAPADAARTDLPADSVDVVTSSLVLEHVPRAAIAQIYREMFRVLKPGGIMSHSIDMSDHFSHSDARATPWDFLTRGRLAWRLLNPPFLYQNRLRASEHLQLIRDAGFRVVQNDTVTAGTRDQFDAVAERFVEPYRSWQDAEDLRATHMFVVGVKPSRA